MRVAVAGAAGRMGATVCRAVEGAPDIELVARADPALGTSLADVLTRAADVLVDFTGPGRRRERAAGDGRGRPRGDRHHGIRRRPSWKDLPARANVFIAPNFAIGAVLMMRFAVEAARHMAKAEIIELHHDGKVDAPSGTAARTAQLMREAGAPRCRFTPCGCPAWSPIRR